MVGAPINLPCMRASGVRVTLLARLIHQTRRPYTIKLAMVKTKAPPGEPGMVCTHEMIGSVNSEVVRYPARTDGQELPLTVFVVRVM